ncbi:hypothetical protein [Streptomyces sp. NPDC048272]|uniref:hypothetical protein n=1 Tax=Streptomyces sp. NPDC048272 TaxID=3154616 RepID=UPI00343969DA
MPNETITPKQLGKLRHLIRETGIGDPEWPGSWAKPWLTMRERDGHLSQMSKTAASKLFTGLDEAAETQSGGVSRS